MTSMMTVEYYLDLLMLRNSLNEIGRAEVDVDIEDSFLFFSSPEMCLKILSNQCLDILFGFSYFLCSYCEDVNFRRVVFMTIFLNNRFSLAFYLHKVLVLRLNQ